MVVLLRPSREEKDRYHSRPGMVLEHGAQVETVEARHVNVGDEERRRSLPGSPERILGTRDSLGVVARFAQDADDDAGHDLVVVNDDDPEPGLGVWTKSTVDFTMGVIICKGPLGQNTQDQATCNSLSDRVLPGNVFAALRPLGSPVAKQPVARTVPASLPHPLGRFHPDHSNAGSRKSRASQAKSMEACHGKGRLQ